jgi:hypothetical protein
MSRIRLRLGVAVAAVATVTAAGAFGVSGGTTTTFASTERFSTSPGTLTASGRCSRATARQLVEEHHLNDFVLPNPVVQLLCGTFTGPGSEAMAITIGAPTCWGTQQWAVFRFTKGDWRLVLHRRAFIFPLVAVGADIRERTPVFRQGDGRCTPSGGSHARIWHWNGTRFVAGPWEQVAPVAGPDPWVEAQAGLAFQLFRPSNTLGLKLIFHRLAHCQPGNAAHRSAAYGSYKTRGIFFEEFSPRHNCADAGEWVEQGTRVIGGITAVLGVNCGGPRYPNCTLADGPKHGYVLIWTRAPAPGSAFHKKTEIFMGSGQLTLTQFLKVARSVVPVTH